MYFNFIEINLFRACLYWAIYQNQFITTANCPQEIHKTIKDNFLEFNLLYLNDSNSKYLMFNLSFEEFGNYFNFDLYFIIQFSLIMVNYLFLVLLYHFVKSKFFQELVQFVVNIIIGFAAILFFIASKFLFLPFFLHKFDKLICHACLFYLFHHFDVHDSNFLLFILYLIIFYRSSNFFQIL